MKLFTVILASSFLATSAFGVTPVRSTASKNLLKDPAAKSPLFRDPAITRGGAIPGWKDYDKSLDKYPITTKACTSLVGWALGDFLAQVRWTIVRLSNRQTKPILMCAFSLGLYW